MITILALVSVAAALFCALLLWRVVREERLRSEARVAALASAIDGPPVAGPAAMPNASFFEVGHTSPMQGRPLLKIAVGFVMAVTVIVLIAMTSDREQPGPRTAAQAANSPLELISMRHARAGEALTITGLVRNPGDTSAGRIIAVVLAFDRAGDFIASGRGPLEFPTLAAGDESPFQVTIPKVRDVGRYRVSFRTESGVLRHVDLRDGADRTVASN